MRTTTAKLLRSVWMLCFACFAFVASAQYTILDAGFEEGIPTGWVVEKGVGNATWVHDATDTGNELPAKAHEGIANMLFFQDGVSTMATSRLITPKLDLSMFNIIGVGTPLLTFHYANTGRIFENQSFVDSLRIYGRAQESDDWTLLKSIKGSQDRWTKDTVDLRFYANNTAYQICFEAANGNGRGVMIDEVKVIATAFCSAVPTIRITEKTETTAKISWDGSQDVRTSELKVSTTPLTDMSQKGDVYDGTLTVREHQLTGLMLQQNYYVYVRTYCDYNDYSPWASTAFRPDMAVNVPYTMDFEDYPGTVNNEYTDKPTVDTINLPANWTYWKNAHLLKAYSSDYQYYPYRGYGTTVALNPKGVAEANRFLNVKAYTNSTYGTIEPYVILPRLNVDSINKLYITFSYKTPSYAYNKLRVGVVDDPADEGSFTLIEEITATKLGKAKNTWTTVTVSFANYTGHGKYIAIQQECVRYENKTGGANTTTQIDNIQVDYMPTCMKATALNVLNVTNTSAQLTWAGNATAYDLKVASAPMEDMTKTADVFDGQVTATNVKDITGLKPGMSYKWYVKPICGTEWSEWRINTLVGSKDTLDIPYVQDFNNANYGSYSALPIGWTFGGNYTTNLPYLHESTYNSAPAGCYIGGSTSTHSYIVTPCLKTPMNKLQVTFLCYTTGLAYKLRVGIMSDPEDITTFVPMDTIGFEATKQWKEVTVEFDSYTGNGNYVAFLVGDISAGPVYIDDVVVSKIPSCKMVDAIELSKFTSSSVHVAWTPRGEETEWTLRYGPAGFDVTKDGKTITVTGKPEYNLTALEEATQYDIYVRAECGEEGVGPWRMETALTQNAPAVGLGYRQDFSVEKENSKWVFVHGDNPNQWVIGTNAKQDPGNPAAYVSNDPVEKPYVFTPTSGNKTTYLYRTLKFNKGAYTVSLDWKGFGHSSSNFVRVFLAPADVVLEPNDFNNKYGTQTTTVPEGWSNLASRQSGTTAYVYLNQDSIWENGWNKSKVDMAVTQDGLYNLVLMWVDNSTSGSNCPVAVDNIAIDTALCPVPQKVSVDVNYIPATKARLMWNGGSKAEVKIMNKDVTTLAKRHLIDNLQSPSDTLVNWAKDITVWEYVAEGLEVSTKYYYAVRTYNENDTSEWAVGNFTTIDAVDNPCIIRFDDSNASIKLPWKKIGAGTTQPLTVAPTMEMLFEGAAKGTGTNSGWSKTKEGHTSYTACPAFGGNGMLLCSASAAVGKQGGIRYYVYSPYFIATENNQLRFDVVYTNGKTTIDRCAVSAVEALDSTDVFAVLISTDMGQTWKMKDAYVWSINMDAYKDKGYKAVNSLADITNKGEGEFFSQNLSLADYAGDTLQVAFYIFSARAAAGTSVYCNLDNFYVGPKPCEQPKDVEVSEVKENSFKLTWKPGDTETAWRVKVVTRKLEDMQSMENVVLDTVVKNQTSLLVENLIASRPYGVYMQSVCDVDNPESGVSYWTDMLEVNMSCPQSYTLPYVETFDDYSLDALHSSVKKLFHPCVQALANKEANKTNVCIYTSTLSSLPNKSSDHTQAKEYGSSLYMNTPSDGWVRALLPEMPMRLDSLMITFYVTTTNNTGELQVGAAYQDEFTCIQTITLKQYEWTKVVLPFDSYTGTKLIEVDENGKMDTVIVWGNHIALQSVSGSTNPIIYVDDVTVDAISGCLPPSSFKADSVAHDAVHYKWSTRDYESKYQLKIFDTAVDAEVITTTKALVDTTLEGGEFMLRDLIPDRPYYAYITPMCEENEKNWSAPLYVRTVCPDAYTLPYREDFNAWNLGLNQASECWTMHSNHGVPYATYSASNEFDGAYLYASCSTSGSGGDQWQYYILPKMDAKLDTVQLSLMMYSSNATGVGPEVGVMTDPNDTSTFVAIEQLVPAYDTWINSVVLFSNYTGEGQYIAFRQNYGTYMSIDDIVVSAIGCVPPRNGSLLNPTENSMEVKWDIETPTPTYDVLYYSELNDSVIVHVEGKEKTTITGLRPATNYKVYVRSICEDKGPSLWVKIGERATTEVPAQIPYVDNFSVSEQNAKWQVAQVSTICKDCNQWTFGTAPKTNDTCLYISSNGLDFDYVKDRSAAYVYRPMNFEAGRHQMILDWMSEASMSLISGSQSDKYDHMRIFLISTSVDMNEVPAAGSTNGYYTAALPDFAVAEISNRAMRDQKTWTTDTLSFLVPKAGTYYVAFFWNNYQPVRNGEKPAAVDNIKIEQVLCAKPENVTSYAMVSGTEVELDWASGTSWDLKVSSTPIKAEDLANAEYVADIHDGAVTKKPYVVGGMQPNKEYYYAVRTTSCTEGATEWTTGTMHTLYTPYELPFVESFTTFAGTEDDLELKEWKYYQNYLKDIFDGVALTEPSSVYSFNWEREYEGCAIAGPHAKIAVHTYDYADSYGGGEIQRVSGTTADWLVTPNIRIPQGETKLTFDLALTQGDDKVSSTVKDLCTAVKGAVKDDIFAVLVSTDNGHTWKEDDAIIWNDKDGDYKYSEIPATANKVLIDMSKYAGQIIQVAFMAQSTILNERRVVHMDNIRISQTIPVTINDTTCAGYAYRENGFDIPAAQVQPQAEPYIYTRMVTNELTADTLYTLSLMVGKATTDTIVASICEGEVYEKFGFKVNQSGRYINMATSTLGCDSVVVLDLTVNPSYLFEQSLTICRSQLPYNWKNKTLEDAGQYTDEYTTIMGCDSIYTLNLSVVDNYNITLDVQLCEGEKYTLGTQVITETGTYAEPFKSVEGCDSIVTVNVTVNPTYNITEEINICKGASYEIDGQIYTKPGVYPVFYTSVAGCDSIVTYKLNVLEKMFTMLNDTIQEGEVYNKNGFTNLTEEGIYKDTLQAVGGCDSIVVLTLVVEPFVAINEAYATTITLTPNPVKRGGVVVVEQEFAADRIKVEIFSPIGAEVKEQNFDMQAIEDIRLSGFNVSGTYLIRITTDTGDIYMAKLIVL